MMEKQFCVEVRIGVGQDISWKPFKICHSFEEMIMAYSHLLSGVGKQRNEVRIVEVLVQDHDLEKRREPIAVFMGRDKYTPAAMRQWGRLSLYYQDGDPHRASVVLDLADAIDTWRAANGLEVYQERPVRSRETR